MWQRRLKDQRQATRRTVLPFTAFQVAHYVFKYKILLLRHDFFCVRGIEEAITHTPLTITYICQFAEGDIGVGRTEAEKNQRSNANIPSYAWDVTSMG